MLLKKIVVAEDDDAIAHLVTMALGDAGFLCLRARDGAEALSLVRVHAPDLLVLDVMMPRLDGLEVCRRLRAKSSVPIIMLTAKAEEIDKVLGLEIGADDYITKPFSLREFRSRVKAALRRAGMSRMDEEAGDGRLEVGDLRVDFAKRSVRIRGEEVATTFVEFEILGALALHPGRVYTRDMLLTRIWGDSAYRDPRTIDVHIRHLREKVEREPREPEYIFTVRGVGYHFRDAP